jgi:hypothetical protein
VDKGWGIREFCGFNRYALQDIIFFGDKLAEGGNDHPVRQVAECRQVKGPGEMLEILKQIV